MPVYITYISLESNVQWDGGEMAFMRMECEINGSGMTRTQLSVCVCVPVINTDES